MKLEVLSEHEVSHITHRKITELRNASFPGFELPRSYFKQLPHLRVLAYEDSTLIGYAGIDHRVTRFGSTPVTIFGVIDLCVDALRRRQGIGTAILNEIERVARLSNVDALTLVATDHHIYQRQGFTALQTECSWLRIEDHAQYGIATEDLSRELLVKALKPGLALKGPVDLLGYLF